MIGGDRLGILVRIGLRSLSSHKVKNLIVGSIMFFGTLLFVVGTSLLDSVETSMARSIISSLAGHLQVYSRNGRDKLAIFGDMFMGREDVGEIPDFAKVREIIGGVANVKTVVPMGIGLGSISGATELDRTLEELRAAVQAGERARLRDLVPRTRRMLEVLREDYANRIEIAAETEELKEGLTWIDRARSEAFWAKFEEDPVEGLDLLDTRVAPLAGRSKLIYLRYVGTDLPLFVRSFDRLRVVEGTEVPPAHRGMLLNQRFRERSMKLKVARLLDKIHEAVTLKGQRIADDASLQSQVRQAMSQFGILSMMLAPGDARALEGELRELLPEAEGDLDALLRAFFHVDDTNVLERHAWFYAHIAPRVRLYPFDVGDTITLRAWTKRGYVKAVNVKVYGAFVFEGLERSELSGAANLMDLVTFRDLYGRMTAAQREELRAISEEVGAEQVGREEAEDTLFGGPEPVVDEAEDGALEEVVVERVIPEAGGETFDPIESERGLVLNAAILLKDADRIDETRRGIQRALDEAGFELQVVDWQEASGMVGQFVVVVRLVLYIAIFIIFAVALVIINNSMVMATLERVREIGTLRAIGAQRGFVMGMFLLETLVLGIFSGCLGAAAGAGVMAWLGSVGIPAVTEILVFLFSGPRLYPSFGADHMVLAVLLILAVSVVSTFYPAWIATRIQPVEAMQARK